MHSNPNALDLASRLRSTFDDQKTVLVDTGDGIFTIANLTEESHEIFITLGPMP